MDTDCGFRLRGIPAKGRDSMYVQDAALISKRIRASIQASLDMFYSPSITFDKELNEAQAQPSRGYENKPQSKYESGYRFGCGLLIVRSARTWNPGPTSGR